LLLTTGRILSQYNVGAQTRRTDNMVWYNADLLEIYPSDYGCANRTGATSYRLATWL
jgi:predicted molibdopterin-dependent oxidoreductase YjgC